MRPRAAIAFHTLRRGDPGRPVVLLLHGFLGCAEDFLPLMSALEDRRHCIAVDLPGHGRTRTPAGIPDMSACAQALVDWLDREGIERPAVFGYSMGGRLAIYLALRHSQRFRAVIAESASPGLADAHARAARCQADAALAARLRGGEVAAFLDDWYAQPLFEELRRHPDFPALLARRLRQSPEGLAQSLEAMGTGQQPPLWSDLAGLELPLALIVGERDAKFREIAAAMAVASPRIKVHVIAGAGHNAHVEQAGTFAERLAALLQEAHRGEP